MKLTPTRLREVVIVEPQVFGDERGFFMESFNEQRFHDELRKLDLPVPRPFVQDNHSRSQKGVLRGLHYQLPPHPQGKLVRVVRGAVFDVAVDIRRGSPTFGQWAGVELSERNHAMLWIPEGFAHGFVALEDDTHFLYKTTDYWSRECEGAIVWNDPDISIEWPAAAAQPALAVKDAAAPNLQAALAGSRVFGC
jgi:dTDP-4-dehydrorhamnose 3,5-epimerase